MSGLAGRIGFGRDDKTDAANNDRGGKHHTSGQGLIEQQPSQGDCDNGIDVRERRRDRWCHVLIKESEGGKTADRNDDKPSKADP